MTLSPEIQPHRRLRPPSGNKLSPRIVARPAPPAIIALPAHNPTTPAMPRAWNGATCTSPSRIQHHLVIDWERNTTSKQLSEGRFCRVLLWLRGTRAPTRATSVKPSRNRNENEKVKDKPPPPPVLVVTSWRPRADGDDRPPGGGPLSRRPIHPHTSTLTGGPFSYFFGVTLCSRGVISERRRTRELRSTRPTS